MSAILFIRDPDDERRRRAARDAEASIAVLPHLATGTAEHGPVAVVWGLPPGATLDRDTSDGCLTFLAGDVLDARGSRISAAGYARAAAERDGIPAPHDGYHLAARIDADGGLTLAVDPLGLFPVYHTVADGALLVATQPGLLRTHPGFQPALDPLGLAGVLVTNGFVDGATLHRGVRRLEQGHVLRAAAGAAPVEIEHYAVPVSRTYHGLPFEECAHVLHEALLEACRRQVPAGTKHTLLLSGGQDARLLAGVLAHAGVPMTALTRGEPRDFDHLCARGVARRLGIPHQIAPHRADPAALQRSLGWHGLCASPETGSGDALADTLAALHPRVTGGHVMDEVVAGSHLGLCYDPETRHLGFERFFERFNGWSIPVALLRRLLRPEVFGDALDEVVEKVQRRYESSADTDLARTYRFDMRHRERFHVGQAFARLAQGAWPCSPCLDRGLLEVAGGLPMPMLAGRRLEHELLRRFHPELAALPLDHKSYATTPLEPRVRDLLRSAAQRYWRRLTAGSRPAAGRERRYYYRSFNFNGQDWRAVRAAAAASRELAYGLFDRATYDALVPPAGGWWPDAQAPTGSAGVKLLVTLGMWLRAERLDPGASPGA